MSGEILAQFLIDVVFPLLGAVVLTLGTLALNKLRQKYGLELSEKTRQSLNEIALDAIRYAEEAAAKSVKNKTQLTGKQKLDEALIFFMSHTPKVNREQAQAIIESQLARIGAGASSSKE